VPSEFTFEVVLAVASGLFFLVAAALVVFALCRAASDADDDMERALARRSRQVDALDGMGDEVDRGVFRAELPYAPGTRHDGLGSGR
jgi:hypothetical protein